MEGQDRQARGTDPLSPAASAAPTASTSPAVTTDVLVVGAGPVGLFHAFELGLLELGCHVVDAVPRAGGQCALLYGEKPIYDIPALPATTGIDLVERLLRQLDPFAVPFHFGSPVAHVAGRPDGRFDVATAAGLRFDAGAVVIAGGVGAFLPRRLQVPGIDLLRGTAVVDAWPEALAGLRAVVAGNGAAALDAAFAAVDAGAVSVSLLHRRDDVDAGPDALARFAALRASGAIALVVGQPESVRDGALVLLTPDGGTRALPFDVLVERLGVSPRLGAIADWGLAMERKALPVDTERFETSVPGIHAVGDLCTYPGKRKLILCGFHEATLAAYAIAARLRPERAGPLEYTTTSQRLHRLLGVGGFGTDA